jgi:hypothetical protein
MTLKTLPRARLVLVLILLCLSALAWADSGASAAQVQQIVSTSDQGWLTKFTTGVFDNMLYALTAWLETGLYVVWLAVTWAVVRLYSGIGTYLIPIWDFSNGLGFFQPGEGAALAVVSVPPAAAQLLQSMVPWILSLCGLLMFGLGALAIPQSVRDGREPFEAGGALALAAGLMVAFPLLYSVPIHVGNFLGREFYESSHGAYMAASGQGLNSSPPGLFDVLLAGSVFPQDTQAATSAIVAGGAGNVGPLASGLTSTATALGAAGMATQPVNDTSQLSAAFGVLTQEFAPGGDASVAWATAKQAMMVDLEMQASRFIQVILGFMAIIALVGLLMLKGGQIVALVLNYYLGWIACALYVHPSTRPVFGVWLKGHLQLCLWGLLWAFLIFIMDIIVVASQGLQGMVQQAGGPTGAFLSVGMFMMPFMLFAAIHKFKQVAEIADALSATGRMAANAGASVHAAFVEGQERIPVGIASNAAGGSVHGMAGDAADRMGAAFGAGMEKVAAAASKAVAVVPGVGPAAAAAARGGLSLAGQVGRMGAESAAKLIRNVNRFHGAPTGEPGYGDNVPDGDSPGRFVDLTKVRTP